MEFLLLWENNVESPYFLLFFVFAIGTLFGSFFNVCIYRLPINQSIFFPRSHCIKCNNFIKVADLIPLISYVILRGRCSSCGLIFSVRYPCIELLSGILFFWCFIFWGSSFILIKALIFISFLIVIAFIDYDYHLILDKILVWFAGTGILINLISNCWDFVDIIIAAIVGGGILLLIAIFTKGGMGGGDIKFVAALGLWLGLKLTLLTLFLSFVIGGIGSLMLLAFKIKGRKDFIPFGPFIAIAAFISMLYGTEIIAWYLNLL
jgi:leader peptidase (prepilin peptidase)/N-methyltransferase